MKIRLTYTIGGLLLIGMLLVNFVLMIFWKRDALQREAARDQVMLTHLRSLLPEEISSLTALSGKKISAALYNGKFNGRLLLSLDGRNNLLTSQDDVSADNDVAELMNTLLSSAVVEAETGRQVSRSAGPLVARLFSCTYFLVSAQPVRRGEKIIGALAAVRSLDEVFDTLWKTEKIILVYILLNLLLLGTVGFFRAAKLVARPVERLMQLADQYNRSDPFMFTVESTAGEFAKLSNSLNSMLTRIERDRQALEKTVAALEIANVKLKKQQNEMIRAEKLASVGRMAAGLAHEIGNPLGVIQGYLGILARSEGQSDQNKDFIRRSEQELQRVTRLIRQLLDFSRTAKGHPEKFSLHGLLDSVLEMIRVQSVFKEIDLETDFRAEQDTVLADREQLRQVFINCLLNSADAVHMRKDRPDGFRGRITLATDLHKLEKTTREWGEERLRIRLADNGIGITEEQLPVIFDPFYTTKEPGKGTGLGLSVSRSIIEHIDGRMEMEPGEAGGSVMAISLALAGIDNTGD